MALGIFVMQQLPFYLQGTRITWGLWYVATTAVVSDLNPKSAISNS